MIRQANEYGSICKATLRNFISMICFRSNVANGRTIADKIIKSESKNTEAVKTNRLIFFLSLSVLYKATYLTTELATPKFAKFAKDDVANTTDHTPNSSTPNCFNK